MQHIRPGCLFLLLFAGVGAAAWEDEPAVNWELGVLTRPVLRGVDLAGGGVRGGAAVTAGALGLETEYFTAFRGGGEDLARLEGAYRWRITEQVSWAATAAHRRFGTATVPGRRQATELGVTVSRATPAGPTLALDLRRDPRMRANLAELRLAHRLALTRLGAFLEWEVRAGWVEARDVLPDAAGPARRDSHGYGAAGLRLPYRIGARTLVAGEVSVYGTKGAAGIWSPHHRDGELRAAGGISVSFEL